MVAVTNPEKLFWQFFPRFEEITFRPAGRFTFSDNIHFVLYPTRLQGGDVSRGWPIASIDVFNAELAFSFHFQPDGNKGNVYEQLMQAIDDEVREAVIKPRRFFLRPAISCVSSVFSGENGGRGLIRCIVEVQGPPMDGFDFRHPSLSWTDLIPESSSEGKKIKAAIETTKVR